MWGRPESVREEFKPPPRPVGEALATVVAFVPDLLFGSNVAGMVAGRRT